MNIQSFCFGPFQTNTYVVTLPLREGQGVGSLIIDPACYTEYERQQLLNYVKSLSSRSERSLSEAEHSIIIIATHGHLDHLWGAAWASEQFGVPVLVPEKDIPMVEAMQQQYDLFGVPGHPQPFPMKPLSADSLCIVHCPLSIIPTPGHTPGSVCLYFPDEQVLFSGDTLFYRGYGRTDLPGGNMQQLITSLQMLFALPPNTVVYPGHGESTTIARER